MIINIEESKKISFDINVTGTQYNDIFGSLRLNVNGIEYGFPVEVKEGIVSTIIPPLSDIINENILNDGDKFKAKLELIAVDQYIVPWEDEITLEKPVSIKANVKNEESLKKKVKIGIKNISEKCEKKKVNKKIKKEKPKTKFGNKLLG